MIKFIKNLGLPMHGTWGVPVPVYAMPIINLVKRGFKPVAVHGCT